MGPGRKTRRGNCPAVGSRTPVDYLTQQRPFSGAEGVVACRAMAVTVPCSCSTTTHSRKGVVGGGGGSAAPGVGIEVEVLDLGG